MNASINNRYYGRALLWLLVVPLAASILFSSLAVAAPKKEGDKRKSKVTVAMSQPVFEKLQEGQELVDAKDYAGALDLMQRMRKKRKKLSVYESAQVWNLTAYVYYLQEDYKQATVAYRTLLEQGELPEALIQSTLKTLAQLYFSNEQYRKALSTINELIAATESPAADVYMLVGQAHFQLKEYELALEPIKKAIGMFRDQGRNPKENWLLLLRVIYHQLQDYPNMLVVLKEMITLYPKDQYLRTLAGVYSELEDTEKQLAIMESLYEKDLIKSPAQIVNVANLYMLHGVPYKAAKLLDNEINNTKRVEGTARHYRMLSQAWYQSREDEKAILPMTRAAEMADDGELYVRLAQAHMNLDHYPEAAKAIKDALKKGGVKRRDTANVMLGMALFNQDKLKQARSAFQVARKDKRSQKVAGQWIKYVDSELEREAIMNQ